MNEFSQLLEIVADLKSTVKGQQLQIESLREHIAELSEAVHGEAEINATEDQAA
ncbi:hypothetical protein [Microbulbifer sp. TYP-18]|uniref:hypothetical protein n=1 Tax=Microbulbifer sp. TYP-18 TaxID=3230024 RepID=UPI0034C5CBCF